MYMCVLLFSSNLSSGEDIKEIYNIAVNFKFFPLGMSIIMHLFQYLFSVLRELVRSTIAEELAEEFLLVSSC